MSFNVDDRVRLNDRYFLVDEEAPASLQGATGVVASLPVVEGGAYVVVMDEQHGHYGQTWLFLEDELEPAEAPVAS